MTSRELWRKYKTEWECIMSSWNDTFSKHCQLKRCLISIFCVFVCSSIFAWSLRPINMLNTLKFQINCSVISPIFTVDINSSFNIASSYIDSLCSLKKNIDKSVFCMSWTHFLFFLLQKFTILILYGV